MEAINLQSRSGLVFLGYHKDVLELRAHFKNGSKYVYFEVSPDTWSKLKKAKSKGSFLNVKIARNHKYKKL